MAVKEFSPRGYQARCVHNVFEAYECDHRALVVMPTGTGKTVVFSTIARDWNREGRILMIAHRQELISQGANAMAAITGEQPGIEMGKMTSNEASSWTKAQTVVTSVQTMCKKNRREKFDPEEFSLLIVDEAHHAVSRTYRTVIEYFAQKGKTFVLGVTATPDRSDEEALGQVFHTVPFQYEIHEAIEDGWLVEIDQRPAFVEGLDLSKIKTSKGDLTAAQVDALMKQEGPLHEVASTTMQVADGRRTMVFCASVEHAKMVASIMNRWQPGSAVAMDGETDPMERREQLERYANGEFPYLCNCGLFLEGFDNPGIEIISMARPTKSRSLYAQVVGRGTRPLPGVVDGFEDEDREGRREAIACSSKPACLVLDFVGNTGRHKLIGVADILGGQYTQAEIDLAKEEVSRKGAEGMDSNMIQELKAARKEAERREEERKRHVKAKAKYRLGNSVDPFDVLDIRESREPGWVKGKKPTDRQLEVIRNAGIEVKNKDSLTFHQAQGIIGAMMERREKKLCTFKQAKLLRKYSISSNITFKQASKMITAIKECGWRKPSQSVINGIIGQGETVS